MSSGSSSGSGAAVCVCDGKTVFESAAIGQLFTGDVRMQCSMVSASRRQLSRRASRPIASAMIAIAIWQSWLALPLPVTSDDVPLVQALIFLVGGIVARYWSREQGKLVFRRMRKILSSSKENASKATRSTRSGLSTDRRVI